MASLVVHVAGARIGRGVGSAGVGRGRRGGCGAHLDHGRRVGGIGCRGGGQERGRAAGAEASARAGSGDGAAGRVGGGARAAALGPVLAGAVEKVPDEDGVVVRAEVEEMDVFDVSSR